MRKRDADLWNEGLALVVGVAFPVGETIAKTLNSHGLTVVGCESSAEGLENLQLEYDRKCREREKLEEHELPEDFTLYPIVINTEEAVDDLFGWIFYTYGKSVDVVVSKYNPPEFSPILDTSQESMYQMLISNVQIVMSIVQNAVFSMRRKMEQPSHIFNIISMPGYSEENQGIGSNCATSFYNATQSAIDSFTQGLRKELTSDRKGPPIRVTAITVGRLRPSKSQNRPESKSPTVIDGLEPKDVADAVVYALFTRQRLMVHNVKIESNCSGMH